MASARTRVIVIAFIILIAVVLSVSFRAAQIKGDVERLSKYSDDLRSLSSADALSGDPDDVENVLQKLKEVQSQVRGIHSDLAFVRLAEPIIGWIPLVGADISAASNLGDRALADVDAAVEVALAGQVLLEFGDLISGSAQDLHAAYASGRVHASLETAMAHISAADEFLQRSDKIASSDQSESPDLVSQYVQILEEQEPRLREIVDWTTSLVLVGEQLGPLLESTLPLLELAEEGGISSLAKQEEVVTLLVDLAAKGGLIRESARQVRTGVPVDLKSTTLGKQVSVLVGALEAIEPFARGARTGLVAAEPILRFVSESNLRLLSDGAGVREMVGLLEAAGPEIAFSAEQIRDATEDISRTLNGSNAGVAQELIDLAREVSGALQIAATLPDIADELLGLSEQRTHLVLGQTSDELRASGGFVSGIWLITFDGGALVSREYVDVVEVDDISRLGLYPRPPRPLEDHMAASVWLMRDVGWEPDFPSTAAIARSLLFLGQQREVDSVIAITPQAFIKVAEALGGISTGVGNLAADDLLPILEEGTDQRGREFMDVLFQGLIETVNGPNVSNNALDLASAFSAALDEKNILVNMADETAQQAVSANGWAGQLSNSELPQQRDRLTPIDSNVGWSKVDRNIERSMDYSISLIERARPVAKVRLEYQNHSGPGASNCDSQKKDRGIAYELLKNACYWNFARIFVPADAHLITSDAIPLPEHSVQSETGFKAVGEDTFEAGFVAGVAYFGGLKTVPANESATLEFTYDLPTSVVDWNETGARYVLEIQAQAGTSGRETIVSVNFPAGYEYASSNISPTLTLDGRVVFGFNLIADVLLELELKKAGTPD
ncbi:MAG: DUF4012 domain-containing protein [Chloroflexi bacterium]|nr:DUF4012 domain-containing protein [Chloroflexota bacterium]